MCFGSFSPLKVNNRNYPKLKEVDDVLGGAAAWENVDSTPGKTSAIVATLFRLYSFIGCMHICKYGSVKINIVWRYMYKTPLSSTQ